VSDSDLIICLLIIVIAALAMVICWSRYDLRTARADIDDLKRALARTSERERRKGRTEAYEQMSEQFASSPPWLKMVPSLKNFNERGEEIISLTRYSGPAMRVVGIWVDKQFIEMDVHIPEPYFVELHADGTQVYYRVNNLWKPGERLLVAPPDSRMLMKIDTPADAMVRLLDEAEAVVRTQ
jgi:hypothetical protein